MPAPQTPTDLAEALRQVPEAERKWDDLAEPERAAYIDWVNGPRLLRRWRIKGAVARVLHDRPQRNLLWRLVEGADTMGDEVGRGNYPPYTGAGGA